jgi:hypothetical protein
MGRLIVIAAVISITTTSIAICWAIMQSKRLKNLDLRYKMPILERLFIVFFLIFMSAIAWTFPLFRRKLIYLSSHVSIAAAILSMNAGLFTIPDDKLFNLSRVGAYIVLLPKIPRLFDHAQQFYAFISALILCDLIVFMY